MGIDPNGQEMQFVLDALHAQVVCGGEGGGEGSEGGDGGEGGAVAFTRERRQAELRMVELEKKEQIVVRGKIVS